MCTVQLTLHSEGQPKGLTQSFCPGQMHQQQMGAPNGGPDNATAGAETETSSTPSDTPELATTQTYPPQNGPPGFTLPPSVVNPSVSASTTLNGGWGSILDGLRVTAPLPPSSTELQ